MKCARWMAFAALLFLGVTAIVGAIPMLRDPDGEPWNMPQSLLAHSPFRSYLIPGMLLLAVNGLLSLYVLWLTVSKRQNYPLWVTAQGCILAGWIVTEVAMLRLFVWPHFVYLAVAAVLVASGLLLQRPGYRQTATDHLQDFVI